jgi:hypothetical protein
VINVYAYLDSLPFPLAAPEDLAAKDDPDAYYVSEGIYHARRDQLSRLETIILRVLGFQTHVALPHSLCINYLQTLDVFANHNATSRLAKRTFAHLNSALLSPQLLYLTHQPPALATAAIYLAAKEVGVKLPGNEWWEVFDTDREELGFLVVAMISTEGFLKEERARWANRRVPLTLDEVELELQMESSEVADV